MSLDRKRFRKVGTEYWKGYEIIVRKGEMFYLCEIRLNGEYKYKTAFRMTKQDAIETAVELINIWTGWF